MTVALLVISLVGTWAGGICLGIAFGWRLRAQRDIAILRDLSQRRLDALSDKRPAYQKAARPS